MRRQSPHAIAAALVIGALGGTHANAQDIGTSRDAASVFTRALPASDLSDKRAGDSTQVFNQVDVTGSADNISVHNSPTGSNMIGGGSFAGAAGVPIVIQNSGNGVLIQNATIINMTLKP